MRTIFFILFTLACVPYTAHALSKIYIKNEYQPVRVSISASNSACPQPLKNELVPLLKNGSVYEKRIGCPLYNCIASVVINSKDGEHIATLTIKPKTLCHNAYIQLDKNGSIWWGTVDKNGNFSSPEEEPVIAEL